MNKSSIKRWLSSYWWPLKAIQVMRWCSVCDWYKLKTCSSSQDQTMIHITVNFSPHAACFVALLQHESEIYCTNSVPLFNYVDSSPQRHQQLRLEFQTLASKINQKCHRSVGIFRSSWRNRSTCTCWWSRSRTRRSSCHWQTLAEALQRFVLFSFRK